MIVSTPVEGEAGTGSCPYATARQTVEIAGASHAVAVSHPDETAELILDAARLAAVV